MEHLSLAFAGEGPTDYRFLPPLLHRQVEQLILHRGTRAVQVGPVTPVLPEGKCSNQADAVAKEFISGEIFAQILFVHTDAGASVSAARTQRVEPVVKLLERLDRAPKVIGVIPDRETEAWMLADSSALERTIGVGEGVLGAHSAKQLSGLLDPKAELDQILSGLDARARQSRRSRRTPDRQSRVYENLGSELDLPVLARVPAYRTFVEEVAVKLTELNLIA